MYRFIKHILLVAGSSLLAMITMAQSFITEKKQPGSFSVGTAVIYTDINDDPLVQLSASLLQKDIQSVTGVEPMLIHSLDKSYDAVILIGSIDRSSLIKRLVSEKEDQY